MVSSFSATVRRADSDDAARLALLAERTFRETFATETNLSDMDLYCTRSFGAEIQMQEILDSNYVTLLAEVEGKLVAFGQVKLRSPKGCVSAALPSQTCLAELYRLYVSSELHGRGVAQAVMAEVLDTVVKADADCLWLGVWEHNPRAIAFYNKCGFAVVGEHVFQFGDDPQRDLIMARTIENHGSR